MTLEVSGDVASQPGQQDQRTRILALVMGGRAAERGAGQDLEGSAPQSCLHTGAISSAACLHWLLPSGYQVVQGWQ